MDLLSKLGGLSASINPIIGYVIPLFTLHFLYKLAGIIDDKLEELQRDEMINLVEICRKQFKLISVAHDHGQVQLSNAQKLQIQEFLMINFDKLLLYHDDGTLDIKASSLKKVEAEAIRFLQMSTQL